MLGDYALLDLHDHHDLLGRIRRHSSIEDVDPFGLSSSDLFVVELVSPLAKAVADLERANNGLQHVGFAAIKAG